MFNYVPYFRTLTIFLSSPTFKLTISPEGFMTRCWRRAGGQTLETPSWPSAAPHDESLLRGTQRWPIFRWSSNKFGGWHSEGFKVRKVWSRIAKLQRNLKVYSFRRKHSGQTRGSNFTQGHKSWSLVDDIYHGPIFPATSASIPEHTQQCHKPMVASLSGQNWHVWLGKQGMMKLLHNVNKLADRQGVKLSAP